MNKMAKVHIDILLFNQSPFSETHFKRYQKFAMTTNVYILMAQQRTGETRRGAQIRSIPSRVRTCTKVLRCGIRSTEMSQVNMRSLCTLPRVRAHLCVLVRSRVYTERARAPRYFDA